MVEFRGDVDVEFFEKTLASKLSRGRYFRLCEPLKGMAEYQRNSLVSGYAKVVLDCEPDDGFNLSICPGVWPKSLRPEYTLLLERAVGEAVFSGLLADFFPYTGVKLSLEEVGWDEVRSSEMAIFRATREAVNKIVVDGKWKLETKGIRNSH